MPPTVTSALAKPSLPFGVNCQSARRRSAASSDAVGNVGELGCQAPSCSAKRLGQAVGQSAAEHSAERDARLVALGLAEPAGGEVGQEVDRHRLPVPPVG